MMVLFSPVWKQLSAPDDNDPQAGPLVPARNSGAWHLARHLAEEYALHDQDLNIISLETFFEYRRENLGLADYLTQFRLYYDEAEELGGLVLNHVAKSYPAS